MKTFINKPLANLLSPTEISEIVGQGHLLDENKALRKIIESGKAVNLAFYGPPGTGKTTLAEIIAKNSQKMFKKLNCTIASTADIKEITSNLGTFQTTNSVLLYLDEIQYFNKKQQQILLKFIENGEITLIVSTTENPYFYIHSALLSRMTVFEFKLVSRNEIISSLNRAVLFLQKEYQNLSVTDRALEQISFACGGDVRKSLNILELAAISSNFSKIDLEIILQLSNKSSAKYDKKGDEHYNLLSAFQKSMRGSDPNAAIHYLARLLESGDLSSICRRLMTCVCEDVGLAHPQAIPFVKSCVDIAFQVGIPEARIALANAVIFVCFSPKSISAYNAINRAILDVKSGKSGSMPRHLKNKHCDGEDTEIKGQFYKYPHDFKHHFVEQQYLPDEIKKVKYYEFGENKIEQSFKKYWQKDC
ncbi:MAG: replication-associated recombination protein A [Candidatus Paraimprobicoccus trichonymphae]|uniref:Replication-associated recombination protein A n=1 Tax=Candidatus Paraimprobicoccus trichonymphae TaxID=3033793 RepID=A0AA48I0C6_9FIRM|nr:MAG: replication-associated recombination protein A [Candidatus Paraimprobicoccus trichonymphae]